MAASCSPLPYTGNKSCIADELIAFMPPHETYMEPCAGSAEVFFRKAPSPREILNDYSNDITNLYRTLQSNEKLEQFLGRLCLSIGAERLFKYNKELLQSIPNVLDDLRTTDEKIAAAQTQTLEEAMKICVEHTAAFVENQVYSFSSTGQTYGIEARDIAKRIDRLIAATARLRNASILHRDFKDAMLYAASENTFYLLDPPYRGTEGCYPKGNFDEEQHKQLFRLASKIDDQYGGKCKFIITYNNDPYIVDLALSFGLRTKVLERLHGMRQATEPGAQFEELLIANYDMDAQAERNRGIIISKTNQLTLFGSVSEEE